MQTYEYDITRFLSDAVKIVRSFDERNIWWRGHAHNSWALVPKIGRKHPEEEQNLSLRFINKTRVRYSKSPAKGDWGSWLFLAQHYGLPTRLLDWTESPLVALYFACCGTEYYNESGTVWACIPGKLSGCEIGEETIQVIGNDLVDLICGAAFSRSAAEEDKTKKILPILTDHFDLRHLVQSSCFTIHGYFTPLNKLPNCENFLARIEIPSSCKGMLLETLEFLEIHRAHLFPDLENLSSHLVSELKYRKK